MARTQSVSVDQAGGVTADLIAAVSGKVIRVVSLCLSVGGAAVTVKSTLQDKTANTVRMTLVGNATQPAVYSYYGTPESPAFEVLKGDALELVTGVASAISGFITYQLVE
jgi:hypothetical protein